MFIDRHEEMKFFTELLKREHPSPAQLILLYGRRRVGKSELLLHWAAESGHEYTYWEAVKETAAQQRTRFYGKLFNIPSSVAPVYRSWSELWDAAAPQLIGKRKLLILDELPYMVETDPAMLSALQYAWDQYFQRSDMILALCGSHVHAMETLFSRQSPLFGRMTAQWHLEPLPFSSLSEFFPNWDAGTRVAAYAIVGGIPAYLNWLDPRQGLLANLRQVILKQGNMFLAEPTFLLYDEVKEPGSYLAILRAIGSGAHTLSEISERAFISRTSVNFYLSTLQELRWVERRLPVTQPIEQRSRSRSGRYHLVDPYFRFYFYFLEPLLADSPFDETRAIEAVRRNLRGFVGGTAFEELCRRWVSVQGKFGRLPFLPDAVGSHWSRRVQVDVVAINWQSREILLGECKWGGERVDRQIVRELVGEKTLLVLKDLPDMGNGWKVYYALFSRNGFTPAASAEIEQHQGLPVDLRAIDDLLGRADGNYGRN